MHSWYSRKYTHKQCNQLIWCILSTSSTLSEQQSLQSYLSCNKYLNLNISADYKTNGTVSILQLKCCHKFLLICALMMHHRFKLSHSPHCCDQCTYLYRMHCLTSPASMCGDNTQNLHGSTLEWKPKYSPHPRSKVERNPRQWSKIKGQCAVSIWILANRVL